MNLPFVPIIFSNQPQDDDEMVCSKWRRTLLPVRHDGKACHSFPFVKW